LHGISLEKLDETRKTKRVYALMHAILTFVLQSIIMLEIYIQLLGAEKERKNFVHELNFTLIIYARFVCAVILHLSLMDDVYFGMQMMKYALNHTYMFDSWGIAYFMGLLQTLIATIVEIGNLAIILTSIYPVVIVLNFISVGIVAEFDSYVYNSMRNEASKTLLEEKVNEHVFKFRHTTSKRCEKDEKSTIKDELGQIRPLKVVFKSRDCCNKCLYIMYKICRCWFVSVYFYFLPFFVIILSIILPLWFRETYNVPPSTLS
jgi:hypothetical protein